MNLILSSVCETNHDPTSLPSQSHTKGDCRVHMSTSDTPCDVGPDHQANGIANIDCQKCPIVGAAQYKLSNSSIAYGLHKERKQVL